MKKRILLLFTPFILLQDSRAQLYNFDWSKGWGGSGDEYGWTVVEDKDGNIYCGGSFSSTSITFGTTTLNNVGVSGPDAFLVKYNSAGNVQWAKRYGSTGGDELRELAVDDSGNVYIAGYFLSSTLNIDAFAINGVGADDIFLARIDANGNADWAKAVAGTNDNRPDGLLIDPSGRVVLSGGFTNASLQIGTTTLTNAGNFYFFIARFNKSNGNVIDAVSFGSSGRDEVMGFNCSPSTGAYYLTGRFDGSSITMGSNTLTNASGGTHDILVACLTSSLAVQWAQRFGGSGDDEINNAVYSNAGGSDALFVTGSFSSTSMTIGSTTLNCAGMKDIFAARFDGQSPAWAVSAGGSNEDMGAGIAVDNDKNVFITGGFASASVVFDSATLNNAGSAGSFDVFTAVYDEGGNNIFAEGAGESGNDIGFSIFCTSSDKALVTGWFEMPSITFGSNATINGNGAQDGFLAVLEPSTPIGIGNAKKDGEVSIFPNPAKDILFVNTGDSPNGIIRVFDSNGRIVLSEEVNKSRMTLTLSHLPGGIYHVSLFSYNSIRSARLVLLD